MVTSTPLPASAGVAGDGDVGRVIWAALQTRPVAGPTGQFHAQTKSQGTSCCHACQLLTLTLSSMSTLDLANARCNDSHIPDVADSQQAGRPCRRTLGIEPVGLARLKQVAKLGFVSVEAAIDPAKHARVIACVRAGHSPTLHRTSC